VRAQDLEQSVGERLLGADACLGVDNLFGKILRGSQAMLEASSRPRPSADM
jgi:hypothetical protein